MHRILVLPLALTSALSSLAAQERKADPARVLAAVAPFIRAETALVVHADLGQLDPDRIVARLASVTGLPPQRLAQLSSARQREQFRRLRDAGVGDVFLVATLSELRDGPVVIVPLSRGADAEVIEKEIGDRHRPVRRVGQTLLAGPEAALQQLRKSKAAERAELADAFAAAGPGAVQIVILPPPEIRRSLEEAMPTLPAAVGGDPVTVYTRGIRWLAVGVATDPRLHLRLTIASPDKDAAQKLEASLRRLMEVAGRGLLRTVIGEKKEGKPPAIDQLSARLVPRAEGSRLTLSLDEKALAELLQPVLPGVLQAAARTQSVNNFKQLTLAMHNYHDTYGRFPPAAIRDKNGKPLLSWRVLLLPYLDELALYKKFHLDEPWNSEHNKKLIARMPRVFDSTAAPRLSAAGKTTYLAPLGEQLMFPPGKEGLRIADVTDGTAKTIFLVDADDAHAVPWTKPDDLEIDLNDPAAGLATRFGGYLTAFVDASVHLLPRTIDKSTLRALFTRNGGEAVNYP